MALRIVPYTAAEADAAREFNRRMTQGGARSEFLLPDFPPEAQAPEHRRIHSVYYLAVDDSAVRGGVVLVKYPAWLGGQQITATDCMSPLSEGIVDPKHSFVGMQFIKHLQQSARYAFAVGMGDINNPFPRLLRASGWSVFKVPFFFRVFRASRFFREMRVFDASPARRVLSRVAANTGLGALAMSVLHARARFACGSTEFTVETPAEWDDWADGIWERFESSCSFAIARDSKTLRELHPATDPRLVRFLLRQKGRPVAWAAALLTQMSEDKYFGNLRTATILDCVAAPEEMPGAVAAVSRALSERGADLVITNQSHAACQVAFRRAGFLEGPSNFCLGISKALAEGVRSGLGEQAIYITRADGDGRMHL